MAQNVWDIETNSETPREDLERCVIAAERTSNTNVQRVAARARAELWCREQQVWTDRFNAERSERVHAQKFQEAQNTRLIEAQERLMGDQIKVAEVQAEAAKDSARAAEQSVKATRVLLVLTTIMAVAALVALWRD